VSKDHSFFNSQLQDLKRTKDDQKIAPSDYIESEPLAIDLKIQGLSKIKKVPLDIVGVYSYQTEGECQQNIGFQSEMVLRPINVIVNINTHKGQKNVAIESQLLIANNLEHPLTLVFCLRELNKNASPQAHL
jgi:hypothetical protein